MFLCIPDVNCLLRKPRNPSTGAAEAAPVEGRWFIWKKTFLTTESTEDTEMEVVIMILLCDLCALCGIYVKIKNKN